MSTKQKEKNLAKPDDSPKELGPQLDYGDMAGAGMEDIGAEDIKIPFLALAQDLSPEVKKQKDEYIEGLEVGQFFNSVTGEIYPEELYVVPCQRQHVFVEWVPRDKGGGLVDVHQIDSPVVQQCRRTQPMGKYKTDEGNDLIETYYVFCLMINKEATEIIGPIVLAFTSTKIKVYKRIMTMIMGLKVPKGQKRPPLFAHRWKVSSKLETNSAKQDYFNFVVEPAEGSVVESMLDPQNEDHRHILSNAYELQNSISAGQVQADMSNQNNGASSQEDGDPIF